MEFHLTRNKIIFSIVILGVAAIFLIGFFIFKKEKANQADEGSIKLEAVNSERVRGVTISFEPATYDFNLKEVKPFSLLATFTAGLPSEKIDYFKTEIIFSKDFLQIPTNQYVETSQSGLKRIFRVDGPSVANETGKLVIELGALVPDESFSTEQPITLAKIYFEGKKQTTSAQEITIGKTQVVNNKSETISVTIQGARYTVVHSNQN